MLGAIQVNDTIRSQGSNIRLQLEFSGRFKELDKIGEELMRHFHDLTNHEDDEWESATFEENQRRPTSSY
jgi:translation initiation factor IF-3